MSQLGDKLKKMFLQCQGVETQVAGAYNPSVERFSKGINTGTDIGVPQGTPISLPKGNWKIESAYGDATGNGYIGNGQNSGYGNSVLARNQDTGEGYRFSHLLRPMVNAGQIFGGGQIGLSGNTGNTTGPHVDIETYANGMGNAYLNSVNNATSMSRSKPQVDVNALLQRAKQRYGNNVMGISNDPNKLTAYAKQHGGKVIKVQL